MVAKYTFKDSFILLLTREGDNTNSYKSHAAEWYAQEYRASNIRCEPMVVSMSSFTFDIICLN